MITPSSHSPQRQLCLFAKHWVPGTVKTRLGADLGMQAAAELHELFVRHLTSRLPPAPKSVPAAPACADPAAPGVLRPLLAASPDSALGEFSEIDWPWSVIAQGSGDLGQRLMRMFQAQLNDQRRLLVIGADCPDLPAATLQAAWDQLEVADVVLGPARDGGYYLLGLRGPWQPWMTSLFEDIPWSQTEVAETTRRRIATAGRALAELEMRDDVDTLSDLQGLVRRLSTAPSHEPHQHPACSHNQRLLAGIAALLPDHVAAWAAADVPPAETDPLPSGERRSS